MAIHIDHAKCCYANGTCSCVPASGETNDNLMKTHSSKKCCVETCPVGALTHNGRIVVNDDLCTDCGECIQICCSGAISME